MKVLISGGHLTPALAVIHAFRRHAPKTKIVFVGRTYLQQQEKMMSREREEIEKRRITFYDIPAAKLHRANLARNIHELFYVFPSLKQTYDILKKEKPDIFLSFGGYLAFPIALVCRLIGIPVVTHEQTKNAGLANQAIAYLADKIAVSFEDSKKFFPKEKVVVTGNPLRPAFSKTFRKKPSWLAKVPLNLPVVYVTGGSQGSHVINQTLSQILPQLTRRCIVIHQCGASAHSSYIHFLEAVREKLPALQKQRYLVKEWIAEEDVAWIFQHARLVVSRSGANTVQEVMVSKVPALFIPLPFAHNNEQLKNAQWLEEHGTAMVLLQKDLLPTTLLDAIFKGLRSYTSLRRRAEMFASVARGDAAQRVVDVCFEVYESSK